MQQTLNERLIQSWAEFVWLTWTAKHASHFLPSAEDLSWLCVSCHRCWCFADNELFAHIGFNLLIRKRTGGAEVAFKFLKFCSFLQAFLNETGTPSTATSSRWFRIRKTSS